MEPVLKDLRKGQWRWDYAVASHGAAFHAPQEVMRILASAMEYAKECSSADSTCSCSSRLYRTDSSS